MAFLITGGKGFALVLTKRAEKVRMSQQNFNNSKDYKKTENLD